MFTLKREMPKLDEDHKFESPVKYIKTSADMNVWEKSEALQEYRGFVLAINEAVKGVGNPKGGISCSPQVNSINEILDCLDNIIDETPPIEQPQRFGNKAFREWYQKEKAEVLSLLQKALPPDLHRAIPEVMFYLIDAFGNPVRIDYGTGHEISFIMFLYCLFRIEYLKPSDETGAGCKIFPRYLKLCRRLQTVYRMEPAGSCGVWSLDDFQFVPFIWGSSQLVGNNKIEPSSFLKEDIVEAFADDYMFLASIKYINSVKKGPFAEHSNQLWSISGVSTWSKVNQGLLKMYKVEVLSKFPIVQHIVFGSLLTLRPVDPGQSIQQSDSFLALAVQPQQLTTQHSSTAIISPAGASKGTSSSTLLPAKNKSEPKRISSPDSKRSSSPESKRDISHNEAKSCPRRHNV